MNTERTFFEKPSYYSFRRGFVFCLLIGLLITFMYSQVFKHEFLAFDDASYVAENEYVQQGLSQEGVVWALSFEKKEGTYWHPLTWLSHMADVSLFGNRAGYHLLMNMAWHIVNTCLLFLLLMGTTKTFWFSVFTASLFAVHPLNVESVAWISERKNLLSTFFYLLSLLVYCRYAKCPNLGGYLLVCAVFFLGLLAKPMLVTLPFVLFLFDYWPLQRFFSGAFSAENTQSSLIASVKKVVFLILEKIPLLGAALMVSYLVAESAKQNLNFIGFDLVPLSLRIENVFVSYVSYLTKFVWPVNLAVFYPFPKSLPLWQVIWCATLLVVITLVIVVPLRKKKYITVGWLWFLGTLTPVSGILQAGLWPSLADRWAYVPFIGLYIIIAGLTQELIGRRRRGDIWSLATTLFVVSLLGSITWNQLHHWRNSYTLFSHAVTVTRDNKMAHNNLAGALARRGEVDKAFEHLYRALEIDPGFERARNRLIQLLHIHGKEKDALQVYAEGVKNRSNVFESKEPFSDTYPFATEKQEQTDVSPVEEGNRSVDADELMRRGKTAEAIIHYQKILAYDTADFEAHNNLAIIYTKLGQNDLALVHFSRALAVAPENAGLHHNMAFTLAAENRPEEAKEHFLTALTLDPLFVGAHINLGILFAQEGKAEQAISHFEKALSIDPLSIDGHTNMGKIFYQLGKNRRAFHHFTEAARLRPNDENLQRLVKMAKPN